MSDDSTPAPTTRHVSPDPAKPETALAMEIRRRRTAARLSQNQLADLVGYTRQYVSRAERLAGGYASADLVRVLDAELSAGGALIALHAKVLPLRTARRKRAAHLGDDRPALLPDEASVASVSPPPLTPSPAAVPTTSTVIAISSAAGHQTNLILSAADRARRFMSSVELSNVGAADLEQLADDVRHLAVAYPQVSLDVLLDDIVATQLHAFELIEGHQRPAQAIDLFLLAGVASGLIARASHDLGQPREAMTQARVAYVCADNAGHAGLRVWARGLQALIAYWSGDLDGSVRYAQEGMQEVGDRPSTAAVWVASGLARSQAALGHGAACRSAIDDAERLRAHVKPDELDRLGGLCWFSRPRQLYYAAEASAWGGAAQAAETQTLALEALDEYDSAPAEVRAFGDEAGTRCALAVARLHIGEPDGAFDAIRPVLDLPAAHRTHGVRTAVSHVERTLRRDDIRGVVVRRMQEAANAFQSERLRLPR